MQDAADHLIEELMEEFNKKRAIVFNTLQMYRHDRMDYLKQLHQRAREKDFYIGLKVVRGAYMEKERDRAQEKGYPSPFVLTNRPLIQIMTKPWYIEEQENGIVCRYSQ